MKFAMIVSRFNEEMTSGLKNGALGYLHERDIPADRIEQLEAPGAFELPLLAQALAKTGRYDGIICLGCVIKGDTAHFEFISLGATLGIMQGMLQTETPISFGILTTYTEEQAIARSRANAENKGREAAAACLETAMTLKKIREAR